MSVPSMPSGANGEVSFTDLTTAIDGTSTNSNGVELLSLFVNDPPTQFDVQTIADKIDELIGALRR